MNSNMAKNIIIAFNPYNASIIGNEKTATIDPIRDTDVANPIAVPRILY